MGPFTTEQYARGTRAVAETRASTIAVDRCSVERLEDGIWLVRCLGEISVDYRINMEYIRT